MQKEIYLDNAATTRPYDEVTDYIDHINRNVYGNPSSLHTKGIEIEKLIRAARESIAGTLGADGKEVYFTSGGTESNNLAIRGYLEANPRKGRHIMTTGIEHPSVLEVFKHLSGIGYRVDYIGTDSSGILDLEMLKSKICSETSLISIIHVNNEVGTVQPVEDIVNIRNSINRNCAIHLDAIQSYGKIRLSPKKAGIDLMSLSSHKIHGPKGTGALYVSKNVKVKPILFGGGQESLMRSGTENTTGICGFGLASELIFKNIDGNLKKVQTLKKLFTEKLEKSGVENRVISGRDASPYILSVSFAGVKSEVLLHHLEERGIYVSTGSACSSRKNIHSYVLKALGLKSCDIEGAVRFSFSELNTEEEIEAAVDAVIDIIPRIKIRK